MTTSTSKKHAGEIWDTIKPHLPDMTPANGGFSTAKRGFITLPGGRTIFVKIGTDDNTKKWARKEIAIYHFLADKQYDHIPALIATNSDETAFAIEALPESDGWDWSNEWTAERLNVTLAAMNALAEIPFDNTSSELFEAHTLSEADDGWQYLAASDDKQKLLANLLRDTGHAALADSLDISAMAQQSKKFTFQNNALVHNDIRADNCAWNPRLKTVKLVDWNWMQPGDRRIDLAATLVSVHKSGFSVLPYASRLDADALCWMAGFWLNQAVEPIWPGGPEDLRPSQLQSAITSLELAKQ